MSRFRTTIPMDGDIFRAVVRRRTTLINIASLCGVTRQAVNHWIVKNRIPPHKLSILIEELNISLREVESLLAYQEPESISLASKHRSKRVTLTGPAWMFGAIESLATSNLTKRNDLINSILFDYIKKNIRLFLIERQKNIYRHYTGLHNRRS